MRTRLFMIVFAYACARMLNAGTSPLPVLPGTVGRMRLVTIIPTVIQLIARCLIG
jgi:hypothetical protein